MKIGIASDHRGYQLKKEIISYLKNKYEIIDYGTESTESVDYPNYAFKIGNEIRNNEIDFGILICGTGIGMSIACNKVKGIRCAKVNTEEETYYARLHNNANVIAFSENTVEYKKIVDTFLNTKFSDEEKHHRRVEMINKYEN